MNLVADDDHAVAAADVGHPLQILPRPDAAARVVRVAEEQHLGHRVGGAPLKILEINVPGGLIAFGVVDELIDGQFAESILRSGEETVVGGTLDDHFRQFAVRPAAMIRLLDNLAPDDLVLRQSLDYHGHRRNDSRNVKVPVLFGVPAPATLPPVDGSLIVGIRHMRVAENPLIDPVPKRLHNLRRNLEVHVSHPHRDDILINRPDRTLSIPLHAVGSAPVGQFIKIIFSHNKSIFSLNHKPCHLLLSAITKGGE